METVSQQIAGLRLGAKIKAPSPFCGEAEIIGFRYWTSANTGRTVVVADYLFTDDKGEIKQSFDPVDKIVRAQGWTDPRTYVVVCKAGYDDPVNAYYVLATQRVFSRSIDAEAYAASIALDDARLAPIVVQGDWRNLRVPSPDDIPCGNGAAGNGGF